MIIFIKKKITKVELKKKMLEFDEVGLEILETIQKLKKKKEVLFFLKNEKNNNDNDIKGN